jgi:hypothetical protein
MANFESKIFYREVLKVNEIRNGRIYSKASIEKALEDFQNRDYSLLCCEVSHSHPFVIDLTKVVHIVEDILVENDLMILGLNPINEKGLRLLTTEEKLKEHNIPSSLIFSPMMKNVKIIENLIVSFDLYGFSIDLNPKFLQNSFE